MLAGGAEVDGDGEQAGARCVLAARPRDAQHSAGLPSAGPRVGGAQGAGGCVGGPCGEVRQRQSGAGAAARTAVPVAQPADRVGLEEAPVAAGDADVVVVQVVGALQCVAGRADWGADVAVFVAVIQHSSRRRTADGAHPSGHLAGNTRLAAQHRVQLTSQLPRIRALRDGWTVHARRGLAVGGSGIPAVLFGDSCLRLADPRGVQPLGFGVLGPVQQPDHGPRKPPRPLDPVTGPLHQQPPPVDPRQMRPRSGLMAGLPSGMICLLQVPADAPAPPTQRSTRALLLWRTTERTDADQIQGVHLHRVPCRRRPAQLSLRNSPPAVLRHHQLHHTRTEQDIPPRPDIRRKAAEYCGSRRYRATGRQAGPHTVGGGQSDQMICPARGNTLGHTERLTTGTSTPTASAWFLCRESRLASGGCPYG